MPFSLLGGGIGGGSGLSITGFNFQASLPPATLTETHSLLFESSQAFKINLLNKGPQSIEIGFTSSSSNSAIIIRPGYVWIETFASAQIFAKSMGSSTAQVTIFSNYPISGDINNDLEVTALEVLIGEAFTGFEVTNVPVSFILRVDRANLGIPDIDPGVTVDIMLNTIYENNIITEEPIILPWDINVNGYFDSQMYSVSEQYFNDSQIWERTVNIFTPGRYFLGSYYNWAGAVYMARLAYQNGKVVFLSEVQV